MQIFTQQRMRRQLGKSLDRASRLHTRSTQQLGTGKRHNKAADNPATTAIGRSQEAMRRSLGQAHRNAQDGISLGQATEHGIKQLGTITTRLKSLALRASSTSIGQETRALLARDYASLLAEYGRMTNTFQWNNRALLNSDASTEIPLQIGTDGSAQSRLGTRFNDVSLRQVGRNNPTGGASIVSSGPLSSFTIAEAPLEASLNLPAGPLMFNDTVSLTGTTTDPITINAEASLDLGPGPYTIDTTVAVQSSVTGAISVPPSTQFTSSNSGNFDIVSGENDTLRLNIDGTEHLFVFEDGFRAPGDIAQSVNQTFPGLVTIENEALVFKATGEAQTVTVAGGSSLSVLGLSAGQSSTARNTLVVTTNAGTRYISFDEGNYTTDDIAAAINAEIPGLASNSGDRVLLETSGQQAQITLGNGSGNSIFGFTAGTQKAQDTFRFRINYGGWRDVVFSEGTHTAEETQELINNAAAGVASVVDGRVRLTSSAGRAEVRIGNGTANSVFGVSSGQNDTGENLAWLRISGQTRTQTLASGTYTMQEIADVYNTMFPDVASLVDGKLHLSASGPGTTMVLAAVPLNGLLGLPNSASLRTNSQLKLSVDGGAFQNINFADGAQSSNSIVATINAQIPGLASIVDGQIKLTRTGAGASLRVGNGTANSLLGLSNNQLVTAPVQGEDLTFSINGEPTTIHFDPGTYSPTDIRNTINDGRPGFASLLSDGRLRLATQSVGSVNTVTIGSGSMNARLGLTAGDSASGVDNDSLALTTLNNVDLARDAIAKTTVALHDLNVARTEVGIFLSSSQTISDRLLDQLLTTSESTRRIEDTDVARATSALVKAELMRDRSERLFDAVRTVERSIEEIYRLVEPPSEGSGKLESDKKPAPKKEAQRPPSR